MSPRALLQQYVVLSFADAPSSAAAKVTLTNDPRVLSVEANNQFSYSTTPNDHYYAFNPSLPFEGNYQWGMQAMNMEQAWTTERGHAYIGVIDTGIACATGDCSGTTHPDLKQNFRHQFSKNFVPHYYFDTYFDPSGHGTHVSGIIAATPTYPPYSNGDANSGVVGGCWTCSLVMLKAPAFLSTAEGSDAITYAADHGLQAVNMSFGDGDQSQQPPPPQYDSCATDAPSAFCTAIAYASQRDLVMVASSGNQYKNRVQWPARENGVIAVGGIEYGNLFWRDGYGNGNACSPEGAECGSNYGPQQHIVAPAMDVISTITYPTYNPNVHCGDNYPPELANSVGYGDCTGTSMSAPHVTALVGLLRSVDPLLSKQAIETILTTNATPCMGTDIRCGNGIPNAGSAVAATIGVAGANNRLTPLFSFYSADAQDHFYTTVPQMAMAALTSGQLLPQPGDPQYATPYPATYDSIGVPLSLYTQFPKPPCAVARCVPEATASVFVSHVNPLGGTELVALNRFSLACFGSSDSYCSTHPGKLRHVYSTSTSDTSQWLGLGYRLDGIEGYIYPSTIAQPAGTVKLCRAYDATLHDYALFLGTGTGGTSCASTDGYVAGGVYNQTPVSLGWVLSARDPQPVCAGGSTCADLMVSKTHSGNFVRGQTGAVYTITVGNIGGIATSGVVSVVDLLPAGLTATAISGTGWTCTIVNLTCTRNTALAAGSYYPSITVTVTVSTSAPSSLTNAVTVSGGGDSLAANNSASDVTTTVACTSATCGPDLTITKTHAGNFVRGQTGATYTISVHNGGAYATAGAVSVVDTLPAGLTRTAISGTGWSCTLGTLTCTRSDALPVGSNYPAITVTVTVAQTAASSVTNVATVSGGGDAVVTNNTASDVTATVACTSATCGPDLTITKTHAGNFVRGQTGATYTISVHNGGAYATSGAVSVVDTLPAGLTPTSISGTGWSCALGTLTCTRSDALAASANYPAISLAVTVSQTALSSVTNVATVSGGGDAVVTNNTASDVTATVACTSATCGPDLTITKTHVGNFVRGQSNATYTIAVHNGGSYATAGAVSVVDTLPAGLTPTAISGTGWSCTLGTLTCTRSDALAVGLSYPAITVVVSVPAGPPTTVTNVATVNGGGDVVASNNVANDATNIVVGPPDIAVNANANLTVQVSNVSSSAMSGINVKVSFTSTSDGSGVTLTWPSGCVMNPPSGTDPVNLVASFTCSIGTLAAQSSTNLVFSGTTTLSGVTGIMSVSLIPPTSPADVNSANDSASVAVVYGGSGS
ncbi:MAG: S8 family serine peptidase [Dokdonella sp.]